MECKLLPCTHYKVTYLVDCIFFACNTYQPVRVAIEEVIAHKMLWLPAVLLRLPMQLGS